MAKYLQRACSKCESYFGIVVLVDQRTMLEMWLPAVDVSMECHGMSVDELTHILIEAGKNKLQ